MAIFERSWRKDMTKEEAVELVKDAIESGIFNDLGSGSNVDVTVITKGKMVLTYHTQLPFLLPPPQAMSSTFVITRNQMSVLKKNKVTSILVERLVGSFI